MASAPMRPLGARLRGLVRRHVGHTALVLIYHRVTRLERDPQLLAVTPEHFDEQMRVLADTCSVISLGELLDGLRHRSVRERAVVVTFDDGYADNLLEAEPVLATHGVPATVFVSSGYVDEAREFWWDEVDRVVLSPGTLPKRLSIAVHDATFERMLDTTATYSGENGEPGTAWDVESGPGDERQQLYRDLCAFLRPLSAPQRDDALQQLRDAAGVPQLVRPTHRPLTVAEVAEIDHSTVVEVGAHTISHQVLSARTADEQRTEILNDKRRLAEICGHKVSTFSYPYGSLNDYTDQTVGIVRDAGFAGACSNHPGVVKAWTDPYRVPRLLVRDWDGDAFSRAIEGWFR